MQNPLIKIRAGNRFGAAAADNKKEMPALDYKKMSKAELAKEQETLLKQYRDFQARKLNLDMTRGKPCTAQLDLSNEMLDVLNSKSDFHSSTGPDCRNYGMPDGLPEMREIMARMMSADAGHVILGGASSLNMMFDTVACGVTHGFSGCEPWGRQDHLKFLCPSPGYDRHFRVTEYFGFELVVIPMKNSGPDMDAVEEAVKDPSVKGIWCVPKYSNPTGVTYSDETVRRFAKLKPAAKDFRIFWDNAYCVHDLTDTPDRLLSLWQECEKEGTLDSVFFFASTSKITFPGAGVAALACGDGNYAELKKRYSAQIISPDKMNLLRHVRYLKNYDGVLAQMAKQRAVIGPKFAAAEEIFAKELGGRNVASWSKPNGGYFISVDVMPGCAKQVVQLCAEAGVKLTSAGATFPYGKDPQDSNIRVAPTFPTVGELKTAAELFCIAIRLAAAENLLAC